MPKSESGAADAMPEDAAGRPIVLSVRDLRIDIPTSRGILHAVRGVSLEVRKNETVCIVGESGCGKSLTSLAVMGLLPRSARRSADRLELAGRDLQAASASELERLRGDRFAMIFQEPMTSLNPVLTIGEQMAEVLLGHRQVTRAEAMRRAAELLERVGITASTQRLAQYPHHLSGGLRQRVMIAMMLMCEPDLLIADEPTTALDVTVQAQILHLLAEIQREVGMGLLLITHDLGVVASIADRVFVMYAGEVVESGTAAEVFNAPLHPYTQGLLASTPVPGLLQPNTLLRTIRGTVPTLYEELQCCAFAGRCDFVMPECRSGPVELKSLAGGHSYRCLLPPNRPAEDRP